MDKKDNKFLDKKNKRNKCSGIKKSESPRKKSKIEISNKINETNIIPKSFKFSTNLADIQDLNPYCNYVIIPSIYNTIYLVYASGDFSIACYDLINNLKIWELKNCHSKKILFLKHIYEKENKKKFDFIIIK